MLAKQSGITLRPHTGDAVATHGKVLAAKIESLGAGVNRIVLTEKAAQRLDIKTAPVQEQAVARKRVHIGEVVGLPVVLAKLGSDKSSPVKTVIRLPPIGDLNDARKGQPIVIVPVGQAPGAGEITAPDEQPAGADQDAGPSAYLAVDKGGERLVAGQRLRVELAAAGDGVTRKVVPYAAVIYDPKGAAWLYTSPEPLIFVRRPITVDFIDG